MATRSMVREIHADDTSAASMTLLKLFEEKSVEEPWVEVLSAGESLDGCLPKVTDLRAKAVSSVCLLP